MFCSVEIVFRRYRHSTVMNHKRFTSSTRIGHSLYKKKYESPWPANLRAFLSVRYCTVFMYSFNHTMRLCDDDDMMIRWNRKTTVTTTSGEGCFHMTSFHRDTLGTYVYLYVSLNTLYEVWHLSYMNTYTHSITHGYYHDGPLEANDVRTFQYISLPPFKYNSITVNRLSSCRRSFDRCMSPTIG